MASPRLASAEASLLSLGGSERNRRHTSDPDELKSLFTFTSAELTPRSTRSSKRRATINPNEVSHLFDMSFGLERSGKSSGRRSSRPTTPPSPLETANKVVKSILKSSKPDFKGAGPRSVTFHRTRAVLAFDNSLPVTSLTPASKPFSLKVRSGSSGKDSNTPKFRKIDEEGEEVNENLSQNLGSQTDATYSKSSGEANISSYEAEATMTLPKMSDFLNSQITSGECQEPDRRQTMAVPSLLDFAGALSTESDLNEMIMKTTDATDSTMAVSSLMSFANTVVADVDDRRSTMAPPSLLDFVQRSSPMSTSRNDCENMSLNSSSRRETLALPSLLSFASQSSSVPLHETVESPAGERRTTLAAPSLRDFLQDERTAEDSDPDLASVGKFDTNDDRLENRRETLALPSMLHFLSDSRRLTDASVVTDVQGTPRRSKRLEATSAARSPHSTKSARYTDQSAIEKYFPTCGSIRSLLSDLSICSDFDIKKSREDQPSILGENLERLSADEVARSLIGVHESGCAKFREEQLQAIVQDRLASLESDITNNKLGRGLDPGRIAKIASVSRDEAALELSTWLDGVYQSYLKGPRDQLARLEEDSMIMEALASKLEAEKVKLEKDVRARSKVSQVMNELAALRDERDGIAARITASKIRLNEIDSTVVQRQASVLSLRNRIADMVVSNPGSTLNEAREDIQRRLLSLSIQQSLSLWTLENATLEYAVLSFGTFRIRLRMVRENALDATANLSLEGPCPENLQDLLEAHLGRALPIIEVSRLLCRLEIRLSKNVVQNM